MNSSDSDKAHYVHKVREGTRRYIRDLLTENERLRLAVAGLEDDKRVLEETVTRLTADMSNERRHLTNLQQQLESIEQENRRFSEQFIEVEQQNSYLANLYVASYRLHSTLKRDEVLSIIQEIIINLIGSEELGVFELDSARSMLRLVSSFGIQPESYQSIPLGSGVIGKTALTGEVFVDELGKHDGRRDEESKLTSCIPLKLGDRVIGAIAIFTLLQQKPGLQDLDHELFDLLATHAATALYSTRATA